MAITDSHNSKPYPGNGQGGAKPRRTSINAHLVQSISVTMSYADMRALIDMHEHLAFASATEAELDIIRELRDRVEEIT